MKKILINAYKRAINFGPHKNREFLDQPNDSSEE
jgi:hypothetical protein